MHRQLLQPEPAETGILQQLGWVGVIPASGNDVIIDAGTTVIIDSGTPSCKSITINGTLNIIGVFNLQVNGNWTNNGTFNAGTDGIVEFIGGTSAIISGTTITNFKEFKINKGTSQSTLLEINSAVTISTGGKLTLANGLLKVNTGGSLICYHNYRIDIPSSGGIHINGGSLTTGDFSIFNNGLFKITSGSATLGQDTGNSIQTETGGTLQIDGGNIGIAGRLVNTTGIASISGGTINLATNGNASSTLASFDMSPTTNLTITGGTIILNKPNTSTFDDIHIENTSGTKLITGGTFQMGSASTLAGTTFKVNSVTSFNDFIVNTTNSPSVILVGNDLTIKNQLNMQGGKIDATSQKLILSSPSISSLTRTSGFIVGKVQRAINSSGINAYLFPVGNGSNYTPLTLNFSGLSLGGSITIESINGIHPNIGTSLLNNSKTANTYWNILNSGVSFTSLGTDFVFPAVSGNSGTYKVGVYNGASWVYPTISSSSTTSVSFSGLTSLGPSVSFAVAECLQPTITLGANPIVCQGITSANLLYTATTNSPNEYRIDFDATANAAGLTDIPSGTSLSSSPIVIGIPAGITPGTYNGNLYVSNASDCESDGVTFTITVNPNASIALTSAGSTNSQTVCINTAVTNITYLVGGGGTGANVTGLPAGVNGTYNAGVFTISGMPTTSGIFNYTVTTSGTCSQTTATGIIVVNPNNTVTVASSTPNICINTAIPNVTHTTTGATGIGIATGLPMGVTASWASNTITISGTPSVSGTFNYLIPLTGGCGTVSATGTITVNPLPTPTITGPNPVCIGSSGNIYSTEAGMSSYVWNVSAGGTITSGVGTRTITITWNTSGAKTVSVNYTNSNTCTATTPTVKNITVNSLPTATITAGGPTTFCQGGSVVLTSSAGSSYSWSNGANSPSIIVNTSGSYTVTVTDANGCSGTSVPTVVTVNPLPNFNVFSPPPVCSPSTINLFSTISGDAGITYKYYFDAALTTEVLNYTTVSVTGTYYIRGATPSLCYDTKSVTVTVNPAAQINNLTAAICSGNTFIVTPVNGTDGIVPTGTTYTWSAPVISPLGAITGGSAAVGQTTISQTLTNILTNTNTAVEAKAIYTVTPKTGTCTGANFTVTVTVQTKPTITAQPIAVFTFCAGSNSTLSAIASSFPTATTIQWYYTTKLSNPLPGDWLVVPNGNKTISGSVFIFAGATENMLEIRSTDNTNSHILYKASFSNICGTKETNISDVSVDKQGPQVNSDITQTVSCAGGTITLTAKFTGGGGQTIKGWLQYNNNNIWQTIPESYQDDANAGNLTFTYSINTSLYPPNPEFRIYATGKCGTTNSSVKIITVQSVVTTSNTCVGGPTAQFYVDGSTTTRTTWSVSGGGSITPDTGVFSPTTSGFFTATYIRGGCTDTKPFIVFPQASTQTILSACGVMPSIPISMSSYTDFVDEYSLLPPGSSTWSAYVDRTTANNMLVTTTGCWSIRYRYKTKNDYTYNTFYTIPAGTVGPCIGTLYTTVYPPKPSFTASNSCGTFSLPSVPSFPGFTTQWSFDGGITYGTTTPTIPGCYTLRARYAASESCGGNTVTGTCESDPVNVVFFPPAPLAPIAAGCGSPIVVSNPTSIPNGFSIEYSIDGGSSWTSTTSFDVPDNCVGYSIKSRYVTNSCGTIVAGAFSPLVACGESPVTIRKVDATYPTISCVTDQTLCVNSGNAYLQSGTSLDAIVTSENCAVISRIAQLTGTTTGTISNTLNGVTFNQGTTLVSWSVFDGCNTSTCSFSVTVNPKPVIDPVTPQSICSGGTFTVTPSGTIPAGTTYSWAAPVVTGITGAMAGTNTSSISGTLINTTAAPITVVYTVTPLTAAGCTGDPFDVTVTVNPNLNCTIDGLVSQLCPDTQYTYTAQTGMSNYNWTITGDATIVGPFTNESVTIRTSDICSGSFTLSLNYNDTNGCGSTCELTATILDATAPVITVQAADANADCVSGGADSNPNYLAWLANNGGATATDNCGGTISWTNNSATQTWVIDLVGHTKTKTVTFVASDECNNSAITSQTTAIFTITDDQPPTITCPGPSPIVLQAVTGECEVTVYTANLDPVYADVCSDPVLTHILEFPDATTVNGNGSVEGLPFPLGTTTVTYTVTDDVGNQASCEFSVVVEWLEFHPIIVNCPPDPDPVFAPVGEIKAFVEVEAPTYDDPCIAVVSAEHDSPFSTETGNANGLYPIGTTTVTWTITDVSGNTYECEQIVVVLSVPVIECPPIVTAIDAVTGECYASVDPGVPTLVSGGQPITWTWTMIFPAAAAIPNETGGSTTTKDDPLPLPIVLAYPHLYNFPVGTTTIVWTATNDAGSDQCEHTVTVFDSEPPTFNPPGPFSECVESLFSAVYNGAGNVDLNVDYDPDYPHPYPGAGGDYYLFHSGDTRFDLDLSLIAINYDDNCCVSADGYTVRWEIDFDGTEPSVSGNGQPSTYTDPISGLRVDIKLWGDGVTFGNRVHTINYWITDCHGNENINPVSSSITIKPRPKITKIP